MTKLDLNGIKGLLGKYGLHEVGFSGDYSALYLGRGHAKIHVYSEHHPEEGPDGGSGVVVDLTRREFDGPRLMRVHCSDCADALASLPGFLAAMGFEREWK